MKVLQVNCVYRSGSTGKITYDLHRTLLSEGYNSVVCYGRLGAVNEPGIYKTCPEWYAHLNKLRSMFSGIMYGGCFFSTNRLIAIIKKEKPDIVHLQCINGYFVNIYRLIDWLKKNHIKTVVTLHAEFMYTGGCGYAVDCNQWRNRTGCGCAPCPRARSETKSLLLDGTGRMWRKMKAAFDGFDADLIVTSVSPWLMERAQRSPILSDKQHCVVMNGLDTDTFRKTDVSKKKAELGYDGKKIVFHVTASFSNAKNHLKGGHYVLELAKRFPDYLFIIAGTHSDIADLSKNVILLGHVSDQTELAEYYNMADVTLLTSRKETFSMPTAESLCCGTPVVGFSAGGPEKIAIGEYSRFVEYGNVDQLAKAVQDMISKGKDVGIADIARKKYSTAAMTAGYIDCYKRLFTGAPA